MQAWEEKIMEREKGRADGKAEAILEILEEYGKVPNELRDRVLAQRDLEMLKRWLKVASKVDSIEEFIAEMSK